MTVARVPRPRSLEFSLLTPTYGCGSFGAARRSRMINGRPKLHPVLRPQSPVGRWHSHNLNSRGSRQEASTRHARSHSGCVRFSSRTDIVQIPRAANRCPLCRRHIGSQTPVPHGAVSGEQVCISHDQRRGCERMSPAGDLRLCAFNLMTLLGRSSSRECARGTCVAF